VKNYLRNLKNSLKTLKRDFLKNNFNSKQRMGVLKFVLGRPFLKTKIAPVKVPVDCVIVTLEVGDLRNG